MGGMLLAERLAELFAELRTELGALAEVATEERTLDVAPTTPKGAGCARQVATATQLLPFS